MEFPMMPDQYREGKVMETFLLGSMAGTSFLLALFSLARRDSTAIVGLAVGLIIAWNLYKERDLFRLSRDKVVFGEEIRVLDRKNRVISRLDYAKINGFEPRTVHFSWYSRYGNPRRTPARELIFIYHGECLGFDSLNLKKLYTLKGEDHYSVGKIFHHPNCLVLAYDEKALRILGQKTVNS